MATPSAARATQITIVTHGIQRQLEVTRALTRTPRPTPPTKTRKLTASAERDACGSRVADDSASSPNSMQNDMYAGSIGPPHGLTADTNPAVNAYVNGTSI